MKNFFEHQEEARRSTAWLVALYALAVVGLVAALYVAAVVFVGGAAWWEPGLLVAVALCTGLVVGGGSAFKLVQLRGGGSVVAEQLGGRPLDRSGDASTEERRLLNVVEEMAIAAGVPVPSVYVLEEESINAFAAGNTPEDAVVGVTRGCLRRLERDELQGVIAHEFSHILNGDMRINLRLIGLLHGLLLIGLIGRMLMYSGGRRRRRDRGNSALLGLAVFAIGSIGVLAGRMIQSAISRQREFLADASAVQFTRNPAGLTDALKKIGGLEEGGRVERSDAQEASHLFFSYPLSGKFFGSLFSTHPPLEERIRRLDPSFEGNLSDVEEPSASASPAGAMGLHGGGARSSPDRVADSAGTLDPEHVGYGRDVVEALTPALREAVHEPLSAVALVYSLLLDPDDALREEQLSALRERLDDGVYEETQRLFPLVQDLDRRMRLPLLDLAAPALRDLSPPQYGHLSTNIERLIEADQQLTIFEYALRTIVQRRLGRVFRETETQRARYGSFRQVRGACEALLAALAHVGHRSDEAIRGAFRAGLARFPEVNAADADFRDPAPVSPQTLDRALRQLDRARPKLQRQLIEACAHCVLHDREVTPQEAELLRAVAIALGCPLPPFLPQTSGTAAKDQPPAGQEAPGAR